MCNPTAFRTGNDQSKCCVHTQNKCQKRNYDPSYLPQVRCHRWSCQDRPTRIGILLVNWNSLLLILVTWLLFVTPTQARWFYSVDVKYLKQDISNMTSTTNYAAAARGVVVLMCLKYIHTLQLRKYSNGSLKTFWSAYQ